MERVSNIGQSGGDAGGLTHTDGQAAVVLVKGDEVEVRGSHVGKQRSLYRGKE